MIGVQNLGDDPDDFCIRRAVGLRLDVVRAVETHHIGDDKAVACLRDFRSHARASRASCSDPSVKSVKARWPSRASESLRAFQPIHALWAGGSCVTDSSSSRCSGVAGGALR